MMNAQCGHDPDVHAEASIPGERHIEGNSVRLFAEFKPRPVRVTFETHDEVSCGDCALGSYVAVYVGGARVAKLHPDDARDVAALLSAMADAHDRRFPRRR